MSPSLRRDLGLGLADLGWLGAVFGLLGGVMTLAAGVLIDRLPRMRLLAISAATWAVAMLATGAAPSLLWLLGARALLSIVLATLGPAYPSLIGDVLPRPSRGRALGVIDSGQLIGGLVGFLLGGICVIWLSWRWAFWLLIPPALLLAWALSATSEPRRSSRAAEQVSLPEVFRRLRQTSTAWQVMLATSVGNYFLAGASAFAVLFAVARYRISNGEADFALLVLGAGALAGVVLGSRASDRLVARGRGRRRLTWSAAGYLLTTALWLPALLTHSLLTATPFLILGSASLSATIPALDAVRIDVIPAHIRGRTEAVRTFLRAIAEGGAPLIFGLLGSSAGGDNSGLQLAFLVTLPALAATAALLLLAARSHDRDLAAAESMEPDVQ